MKKRLKVVYCFAALVLILGASSEVIAFPTSVHELLNTAATRRSTTAPYLKDQLGFSEGLETQFGFRTALEWIGFGGKAEDQFLQSELLGAAFRSRHHFHNPLLPWDQAGLNALSLCPPFRLSGEASVRWAQSPNQELSGQAAWVDARRAFYEALTLPFKAERDQAWARTFQILGQQMHLIADLAVPAHVRNDQHCPGPEGFEAWADRNGLLIEGILAGPTVQPDRSVFALGVPVPDAIATAPVARLWDSDQYDGTNPSITLSPTSGLAEYANANFFSDDTVFKEFPFPAPTSVELGPPEPEPKTGELRRYFKKVRDGELIDHLAVSSALYEFLPEALKDRTKGLDDNVFQDYAAKLLPRAVGYSAALLDYFFRGSLAVWQAYWDDGKVVLDLSNEGDEIMEGVFEVYAIHDKGSAGERRVKFASLEGGAVTTLPVGSSRTFQVDVPSGHGLTRHHILVFRGKLGEEADAVVGHLFLLIPRVLFVQQDSRADIKLERCDRYVWPDPGIQSPDGPLAEERLSCLWTPVNRQISGRLVKNVVDPIIKRIVVRTGFSAAGTRSATIWERQGAEPDPVAITFAAADSPFFWEQRVLFLDIQLTDGPTISTKLATLDIGLSGHTKVIVYEDDGRNKTYAVISTKGAYLAISSAGDRDKTISISGYTNPTNTLTEQRHGSLAASEGVVVNSAVYQEVVIAAFEIYPGGWIEPPKFDPDYAEPQRAFDAIELVDPQIQGGPRIKWESVIERVYYRWEAEFLRAFMPGVPPRFTIQLSGTQQ